MKKGDFIVMTSGHTTGCGKVYEVGHIGCLCEQTNDLPSEFEKVDVRFPTHNTHDSSWIPIRKFKLADDQAKAEKLFNQGEEACKKVFYK